jgi:hypothetical protein
MSAYECVCVGMSVVVCVCVCVCVCVYSVTGVMIQEKISSVVNTAMRAMYQTKAGRLSLYLPSTTRLMKEGSVPPHDPPHDPLCPLTTPLLSPLEDSRSVGGRPNS